MKGILDLIKLIYGSKALSKTLGTRTNVIRLPDNEVKRYIKEELNIEAASDKLAQKAKEEMGELIADLPKMNDAEKLILEGNLRRLANKLGVAEKGPAADVIQFTTKEKISPEGVMSLTEKIGQKNAPGTLMGNLESRIKQLEASGEDLSKLKGKTYDEFMKDITQGQKSMRKLEDEGLVRATAREIIGRDIKSGKIKLPKEIEQDIVQGGGEPINVFRQFYGEDALEQLDSMIPEFKNMYSPREAADAATKKFKFEFKADRPPGSISIEDAKKTEQEFNIIPADSEEGKIITEKLIGKPKAPASAPVTELMTAEKIISDMKNMDPMDAMKEANKVLKKEGKYKNLQEKDVERIMEDTNDFIFGRDIPEDPEGFAKGGVVELAEREKLAFGSIGSKLRSIISKVAKVVPSTPTAPTPTLREQLRPLSLEQRRQFFTTNNPNYDDFYGLLRQNLDDRQQAAQGGSMSQGLDYLTGIERRGYQEGSSALSREEIINRILQEIKPGFESAREVYPDYYSTGLDVDYLKTLDPDEIKQALDRVYLQGESFENADYTSGAIGQGSPFRRYSPEYMKKVNVNNPLRISDSRTAYNLRNQLNELESILGKKNIEAYKTTLDDSLIDYYKTRFTADPDLQKKIFGEQTAPTVEEQMVSPDDAMNQYDIETPETDFFSGPDYDKYSEARTDAYANAPSKFDYDIRANEAAGQFIQDKITGSLGDNKLGRFVGDAAALASVPLAIFGSPFHEAAQVVAENRMEPGSGIQGFAKAFMNEQPFSTAINRGAGVLQSTALGKGIYNLGGDLYNLKEKLQQQLPYMDQYQQDYQTRISQVDPNALRNRYLQNIQNTSPTDVNQFQSQLRSNLVPKKNEPQGLDYLTGL